MHAAPVQAGRPAGGFGQIRERHVRAAPAEWDEGGIEAHGYSLMPVIEIPSMNMRWPKKNIVTIGMTTIVLTAIKYG